MLKSITIDRFRGIKHLVLDDFSAVNVFVGTNGAGKTSVLEALALISNPFSHGFINNIGLWREFPPLNKTTDYSLRTLFSNLDLDSEIAFTFKIDDRPYALAISAKRSGSQNVAITVGTDALNAVSSGDLGSSNGDEVLGADIKYTTPSSTTTATIQLSANGYETRSNTQATRTQTNPKVSTTTNPVVHGETLNCFYIHARRSTSAGETLAILTRLLETKSEQPFFDAMRKVDKRVQRIVPGFKNNQPVILVDIGLPRLIPMNSLGDGFCRVCLMLTGVATRNAKLLIVDEIDSGLHPSVMEGFWRSILDLTKLWPIQLFCTTHNEEMLQRTLPAFRDDTHALRIFRIDRAQNDRVTAQKYTYEGFAAAEEVGLDVR